MPVLWWCVGAAADVELGSGHALGQKPTTAARTGITVSCVLSALLLLPVRILTGAYSPRVLGVFWIILLPVSILSSAAKWRRKWLRGVGRYTAYGA